MSTIIVPLIYRVIAFIFIVVITNLVIKLFTRTITREILETRREYRYIEKDLYESYDQREEYK